MKFSVSLVAATASLIAAAIFVLVLAPRPSPPAARWWTTPTPTRGLQLFIYRVVPGDPGGAVIREHTILFFAKNGPAFEVPRFNDFLFEADPEWKRIMQDRPAAFKTEQWRRFIAEKEREAQRLVSLGITPGAGNARP
jgi:hypothetical protein